MYNLYYISGTRNRPIVPLSTVRKCCFRAEISRKTNDVNNFNISINNSEEVNTNFKDKKNNSKKKNKNYKTLTSILESVDTIVIVGATTTSVTLSVTGVGLVVVSFFSGIACALSLGRKVIHKLVLKMFNKNKNLYEKDQQTIELFD